MDEVEQGLFFGLKFVFSPLLTKIRDTTLPDMDCDIKEHFSHEIDFKAPENGSYIPYQNEFVLNKLGLDSKFETAYRIVQTGDTVSRTFHFIQKDFSTYVIIDYENLIELRRVVTVGRTYLDKEENILVLPHVIEPIEWRIEGEEGKTDTEKNKDGNEEHLLVLPHVRITAKSQVTTKDNGFVFNLTNRESQVLLHVETFPLYKDFEKTAIIADSSQVDEVAAILGFFPGSSLPNLKKYHKYVPVIFFENKDNGILRMNAGSRQLDDQKAKIINQRKQMLKQILELRPKNIIILNSPPEIEILKQICSMINAKVHQLTDPGSGNCIPLEELATMVSLALDMDYKFMSVENHSYLAAASVLARIKGTLAKAIIPIVQNKAKHELRIGSSGYGSGEYCGELMDVTQNIMQMLRYVSDEGVLIEYDGTGQSIMRSILASNYAFMNKTVPVLVEKVNVVNEVEDINRDLQYVADYYKFIEYLKFYKTEVLNEEDLKYSNEPRDIKTLNFLKSNDLNNDISFNEIEKSENLFCWQEIPGNDSEKFIDFLTEKYSLNWAKIAKIDKINDGKTITLTAGKRFISLTLNNENTIVNLKIDGDRSYEFIVKTINGKMNIYNYDIEKIIDLIDEHGDFLPYGPIEISKEIKSKILKLSDKITTSLGSSIQLLHDFKYITAFTDGTPYNLAKCGNEFWATRFALGHFVEDESHKAAAVLLNLLMYSKGREYPIKRILQVAPYANKHSMFKFIRQDDAYSTTKLDTGEVTRKWALAFELINDKSDKDTVIEFGKYISWFNMHFGTHGSGNSISLAKNAELRLDEIMDFNLSHTLIDLNACQTYPFAGKEILSSGAAGGYATLFIVMDKTADEIGKGVFNGTLNHREPSESLREIIEKVVKAGSDGISEFAYVHIGLPKLRPFVRDILESEEKEIQRMKYNNMFKITEHWINNNRKGQDACFQNYQRQKEEYLTYIDKKDHKELYRLFFDEGVLGYERKSFQQSGEMFRRAYDEIKDLNNKTDAAESLEFSKIKLSVLINMIVALSEADRVDEAEIWFDEIKDIVMENPNSVEINLTYAEGLHKLMFVFGEKGKTKDAEKYLPALAKQAHRYPDSVGINLTYAEGLYNLITDLCKKDKFAEAERYLTTLAEQVDRYPDSVEINLRYTMGLHNLMFAFGENGNTDEAERHLPALAKQADRYPDSVKINIDYAKGLNNLIYAYVRTGKPGDAERHLSALAKQADRYPDSVKINIEYAKGLNNLIIECGKTGKLGEAERHLLALAEQVDRYPSSVEINFEYAKGLYNLISEYSEIERHEQAEKYQLVLAKQADLHPKSMEINLEYANVLVNLIAGFVKKGKIEDAERHLVALANQADRYPDSVKINIEYAKGLNNLIFAYIEKESPEEAETHLPALAKKANRYSDSFEINLEYTKGLYNLIIAYIETEKSEEAEKHLLALAKQADLHPDSVEINFAYAKRLYNLIAAYGKTERPLDAERHLTALAEQANLYPESVEINLEYANGLVNLIVGFVKKGKIEDAERHLPALIKQADIYPESVEINIEYAKGLATIILSSNFKRKDIKTINKYLLKFDKLAEKFADNRQIQYIYDKMLEILNKAY